MHSHWKMQNKEIEINTCKILPFFEISRNHVWNDSTFLIPGLPLKKYPIFSRKWVRAWYTLLVRISGAGGLLYVSPNIHEVLLCFVLLWLWQSSRWIRVMTNTYSSGSLPGHWGTSMKLIMEDIGKSATKHPQQNIAKYKLRGLFLVLVTNNKPKQ